MPSFGRRSERNLVTCDNDVQIVCRELIKTVDFSVLCGFRNKEKQDKAYYGRPQRSTKKWPDSIHNTYLSKAVDLAPYPIDWEDRERFAYFAGHVMRLAQVMGIPFIWGADWDNDFDIQEHRLIDMPHFQKVVV